MTNMQFHSFSISFEHFRFARIEPSFQSILKKTFGEENHRFGQLSVCRSNAAVSVSLKAQKDLMKKVQDFNQLTKNDITQ